MEEESYESRRLSRACCKCGIALYDIEVGGEVFGGYIDYLTHARGEIELTYCTECWNTLFEILDAGMRTATAKRRALESMTREDETSHDTKHDCNE